MELLISFRPLIELDKLFIIFFLLLCAFKDLHKFLWPALAAWRQIYVGVDVLAEWLSLFGSLFSICFLLCLSLGFVHRAKQVVELF